MFVFFGISQSVVTLDGDKLVHVQKWDGKETNFVREIKDGRMVMVSTKVTEHSRTPPTLFLHVYLKLVNFTGICYTEHKPRGRLVETSQVITFRLASCWKIADGSVAPGRPACGCSKCILSFWSSWKCPNEYVLQITFLIHTFIYNIISGEL